MPEYLIGDVAVEPGGRGRTSLHVADLLDGSSLRLPLHVINGGVTGPTLAVIALIHGGEHFPFRVLWEALPSLIPADLRGTMLVVPVANPIGFARDSRIVPEDDVDFANVNRVFPGQRGKPAFGSGESHESDRTLAERIAETLTCNLIARADFVLDLHCHQEGIGTFKIIQHDGLTGRAAEWTPRMAKSWGFGIININTTSGNTFSGQATVRGIPACVAEIGTGGCVPAALETRVARLAAESFRNMLRTIGMLPGEVRTFGPQFVYGRGPHVRPSSGGYLLSRVDPASLFQGEQLGVRVRAGELLGEVIDPYRMDVIEELRAPCDGIVYIARGSGPVEASGHAFALADLADGHWEA